MESSELLSGEQTPTRGSSCAATTSSKRSEAYTEEQSPDLAASKEVDSFQRLIMKDTLRENNNNNNGGDENDSFVTMEEIKEGDDATTIDSDLFAKLEYGDIVTGVDAICTTRQNHYNGVVNEKKSDQDKDTQKERNDTPSATRTTLLSTTYENNSNHRSSFRRMSHRLSRELVRRRSSIIEVMPDTPAGWTVLVSGLASALLGYELHLQQRLSCPPLVFGQCYPPTTQSKSNNNEQLPLQAIYDKLTETPESLLSRPIQPSLFVGTRGTMASVAAYALLGPPSTERHFSFRQVLTMSTDGANIAIDWELPPEATTTPVSLQSNTDDMRKQRIISKGGIDKPVVLVLHGMNNDSSFGYVKSLMRTFTDRGWIAAGMNFRGCGGVRLATPRCYNGGYTGDLRGVVQYLESRLAPDVPLFLVGNSLSANIVTKYLGEEGLSGTLPRCVAGGVSLGNPLLMHVNNLSSPWKEVLALGIKRDLLLNWPSFRHMTVPSFRSAIYNTLKARDIGEVDTALAPIFIRNESHYPFSVRIGFKDADDYWADSSSFKYIKHISVPCLQIVASDDILCYKSFQKKLCHCIQNPYVMCVETKCGGHLGWQESPPESNAFGIGTSWADRATADFFGAILETGTYRYRPVSNTTKQELDSTERQSIQIPDQQSRQNEGDDGQGINTPRFRSRI